MSASLGRQAALDVLSRVREREAYAHETLDAVATRMRLEPRDVGFATRLAYGAIATRGTLDEAVARYLDKPGTLEPRIADALALGAWELLFGETPSHVAVNETVELVRSVRGAASGLANAVMRKLAHDRDEFPWGDADTDDEALARLTGHPLWLTELLVRELGREVAREMLEADNTPAPMFLAHLPFRTTYDQVLERLQNDGAKPEPGPLPYSITVGSPSEARRSPALAERAVVVADAAAQLAAAAVRPAPGARIVELGAGRGTKTLILAGLAQRAGEPASILAVDLHAFKLEALSRLVDELGVDGVTTLTADVLDAGAPLPPDGSVDAVLVDAPCSGLGTLRRHPDRRWRAIPEEIDALAGLGQAMLERAARLVKPGGVVVYSTCTVARRENEDVIEAFLSSKGGEGYSIDPLGDEVPEAWRRFVAPQGWFRSLPTTGGPDGHFIARLLRAR